MTRLENRITQKKIIYNIIFSLLFFLCEPIHSENQIKALKASPSIILDRIELFLHELENIRQYMGAPKNQQEEINVDQAEFREVYFQARTLFDKSERFCFERTKKRNEIFQAQTPKLINSDHVLDIVEQSLERITLVKQILNIESIPFGKNSKTEATPSKIFQTIVQANRQLNHMLTYRYSPSDVYMQVSMAINYTARLLAPFPIRNRIPTGESLIPGKVPSDVYRNLHQCYFIIQKIYQHSNVPILNWSISQKDIEHKTPSDVYDIASLIVSELAYLHSHIEQNERAPLSYYPGEKFPFHVYQRTTVLLSQLSTLEAHVLKNSGWLKNSPINN